MDCKDTVSLFRWVGVSFFLGYEIKAAQTVPRRLTQKHLADAAFGRRNEYPVIWPTDD
jgi:hypothetical protein